MCNTSAGRFLTFSDDSVKKWKIMFFSKFSTFFFFFWIWKMKTSNFHKFEVRKFFLLKSFLIAYHDISTLFPHSHWVSNYFFEYEIGNFLIFIFEVQKISHFSAFRKEFFFQNFITFFLEKIFQNSFFCVIGNSWEYKKRGFSSC